MANRLHDGRSAGHKDDEIIIAIANEQRALVQAIARPEFTHKMANAFMGDMAALNAPVPHDDAMREVTSILKNRIEDCKKFCEALGG